MKLISTGDILPSDRDHTLGIGTGSEFHRKQGSNWENFFTNFDKEKDILFGNLEAPLPKIILERNLNIQKSFAGDPRFALWLKEVGYDVVSVANNHILEHGETGFKNTCSKLQQNGVMPVGIYSADKGSNTIIIEKEGIRIGFSAFNAIHDIENPFVYSDLNEDSIKKAILALKEEKADIVCLSFHWGNEYIHIASYDQIQLARLAIDLGADIIIGHHPHVIQPIEQYKNGWIVYSLGNFIFDMRWSKKVRTGMCVEFELNKDGVQGCKSYAVESLKDYTPLVNKESKWLVSVLTENTKIMNELLKKGSEEYNKYYWQEVRKNRFRARVGMKVQLAQQWFSIPKVERRIIRRDLLKKI